MADDPVKIPLKSARLPETSNFANQARLWSYHDDVNHLGERRIKLERIQIYDIN
jgi:hypothetical protein